MKALVLGAGGLLGSNVVHAANARQWEVIGTYHTTEPSLRTELYELDVRDTDRFEELVGRIEPEAVINCTAMTDVDGCEGNAERARAINGRAPGDVAMVCNENDVAFTHVSTDYVFDGNTETPYEESDQPNPIQTYGESKLSGEKAVVDAHENPLLVRLSFVYGMHRSTDSLTGFPAWVRSRLGVGEETPLFTDQRVTPSRAGQAAKTIIQLLDEDATGTFHVASRSCVTPYEFGDAIRERMDASQGLLREGVQSDLNRPADRPRYTCLDTTRVEETLGRKQPTIREDLDTIFGSLV